MGGVLHAILGYGARGRGGQSARFCRGMDGAWPETEVWASSFLPTFHPYPIFSRKLLGYSHRLQPYGGQLFDT